MKETYCPYRKFRQLFNGGKMDEVGIGYCEEDGHPCMQDENGHCRIIDEIEEFISDPNHLEIVGNDEGN